MFFGKKVRKCCMALYRNVMATYRKRMASYRICMALYRKVMATYRKRMALYRKSAKYPTFRTDKARYYRAFQRLLGHTFMLLCLSLGLGVVLVPKLHKYGNKKEGKKNEENNSYHRRVQPAFERAG